MRTPRGSAGLWRYAAAAVLGFSRRADAPPARVPSRDGVTSSYEAPVAADDLLQLGRAAQLPPFGRGNGVDALFWTPVARVAADRVDLVLAALGAEDIAGWVAPIRTPRTGHAPVTAERAPEDLWVASLRLNDAQDVLLRVPPTGS